MQLSYPATVEGDSPLAYYRMNESSGTLARDSSGNGHNATYVGTVKFNRPPLITGGGAASGASFPQGYVTENATWTNHAVTAECWYRPSAADLTGTPRLTGNDYDNTSANGFLMFVNNGKPSFYAGFSRVTGANSLAAGSVYHIVGTFDVNANPSTNLYVNGVNAGSNMYGGNVPNPAIGSTKNTWTGASGNALNMFSNYLSGDMSDCAVYDHALTAAQVAIHYTAGTTPPVATPPPAVTYAALVKNDLPVAYYRMNETSGKIAADSSGHGHSGSYAGTVLLGQPAILTGDTQARSASFPSGYLAENATWTNHAVTAECWYRPSDPDLTGTPRLAGNDYDNTSANGFLMFLNNGAPSFYAGFSRVTAAAPVTAGAAYHIVGTFDVNANPSTNLYVNGVNVGSNMYGGNVPNPAAGRTANTWFGASDNAISIFSNYTTGDVSDCAIYDHALTPAQIAAHYATGSGQIGSMPPPVGTTSPPSGAYAATIANDKPAAYYRMNDASGSTLADSSGNAHPATVNGTVAFRQGQLLSADASSSSVSLSTGYLTEDATWTQQAVSAECWVQPTAADLAATAAPRLIENAWSDSTGKGFELWLNAGYASWQVNWAALSDPVALTAGSIYHIVGTYDGTTSSLYVNGALTAQNSTATGWNPQTGDSATSYLGVLDAISPGPGIVDHLQGKVGDCATYNYALTPAQTVNHYNVGTGSTLAAPTPIPATPAPSAPPSPGPAGTPIAYDANTACIYGKLYTNNVLPSGEGEFASNGLDRTWWSRYRGDGTQGAQLGNWVSGLATSTWGRTQYNTYFGDAADGVSTAADDPFYVGPDTSAPGSPTALRITANQMPAHLVGNAQVAGEPYYAGMLFTPVNLTYGFVVARVRTPAPAPGLSPAFWILQGQGVQAGPHGNLSDEWDVQEMFGNTNGDGMNQGELIWNSASSGSPAQNWGGSYQLPNGAKASADYHDYGILMSPGGAPISTNDYGTGGPGLTYGNPSTGGTFFLDRQPVYGHTGGADINATATTPGYKEIMAMFQVSTGGWLGNPSASEFPSAYWLQWIRVYQPTSQTCS